MNETITVGKIGDELEKIQLKLAKAKTVLDFVYHNYFMQIINTDGIIAHHEDRDGLLKVWSYCKNKDTYTVMLDIADDIILDMQANIDELIDEIYGIEETEV